MKQATHRPRLFMATPGWLAILLLATLSGAAFGGEPVLTVDENGVPTITDQGPESPEPSSSTTTVPARPANPAVRKLLPRTRDASTYDNLILDIAERYDISPALLKAVCLVESAMNSGAVGPGGAMGLMQLTGATARHLGVRNPFDPQQALDGGARYLQKLLREFGSVQAALAAYKNGPGRVRQLGHIPNDSETWAYIERVLLAYDYFLSQNPVGAEDGL